MSPARAAITALVHAYAERLDAGDLAGVAALFANATYGAESGPVRKGEAAVLAALRSAVILHDGLPRTKHVLTNLFVAVDADAGTAVAHSSFTVLQATPALPLQVVIAGRYRDGFRQARGEWEFAERRIHLDMVGELREHVRRA
jgi:3-phenylpropionate/cinnamic acid dioxygenase small subunit